jgi:hypothetical protein
VRAHRGHLHRGRLDQRVPECHLQAEEGVELKAHHLYYRAATMHLMLLTTVANNASTLYLTVEEHLSTYVALMMPHVI